MRFLCNTPHGTQTVWPHYSSSFFVPAQFLFPSHFSFSLSSYPNSSSILLPPSSDLRFNGVESAVSIQFLFDPPSSFHLPQIFVLMVSNLQYLSLLQISPFFLQFSRNPPKVEEEQNLRKMHYFQQISILTFPKLATQSKRVKELKKINSALSFIFVFQIFVYAFWSCLCFSKLKIHFNIWSWITTQKMKNKNYWEILKLRFEFYFPFWKKFRFFYAIWNL